MGASASMPIPSGMEKRIYTALRQQPVRVAGPKRALVLAGGGSYGAYEVGAINVLCDPQYGLPDFDIVCGVSVGAVNGSYFSQFPMGQQQAAAKGLDALWHNLTTDKVYTSWCCGCCGGCCHCTGGCGGVCDYACGLCHKSIYDTSPLRALLEPLNQASIRASGRILRLGVVAVKGAEYSNFDFPLADPSQEVDLQQAIMASAAFPLAFSPEQIDGQWYFDGGVRQIDPIQAAIEAGATDLTIISGSSEAASSAVDPDSMNAFTVALRASALGSNEIVRRDINTFVQYQAPLLGLTYRVIIPKLPLPQDPLNFDQTIIDANIALGEEDARAVLLAERQQQY